MATSIVCAIDQSPHARTAARLGADLARRLRLTALAVHAFVPAVPAATRTPVLLRGADAIAVQERRRQEQVASWLAAAGLEDVRSRVEVGSVPDVISAVAEEENAALIALGTHGAAGLRAMLRGSVSGTLLRIARHPLHFVPSSAIPTGASNGPVVAAVGGPADASWIGVAGRLASAYHVPLLLAHARGSRDGAGRGAAHAAIDAFGPMLDALREPLSSVLTRVCPGPPGDAIMALAQSVDARAIVCGTHGHGALRAALSGSTARRLMSEAAVPVVVCPPRMARRTRVVEAS